MTEAAQAGWARSGDLYIAYEVRGDGPVDLVQVPGLLNTIEAPLHSRDIARFEDDLARFARLIKLDKRGTGQSDRLSPGAAPTVEERIDDVRAVMDEVGCERASLYAVADGGPIAIVFAATYPERVSSLVLSATGPSGRATNDHFMTLEQFVEILDEHWGHGMLAAPFQATTDEQRREIAALERLAGTPNAIAANARVLRDTDVTAALPAVSAPTLVIHHTAHSVWPIEGARILAAKIPNARLIELPGQPDDIGSSSGSHDLVRVIEEFVTGQRAEPDADTVLKTIVFTDIVESTARAAELGDHRWKRLLQEHDDLVRAALARFRGEEVKTTGDGFLAVFDGPARAIRCARAIAADERALGLEVRIGIHTGECERHGADLAGIAVHIGARVAALAGPSECLVTGTVRDLVAGSGIEFEDRGRQVLKGVPGEWQVLAVSSLG